MVFQNRLLRAGILATCGLLLAMSVGCGAQTRTPAPAAAGEMPAGDLANHFAPLPGHVNLPGGFYPLVGQYDPDNPDDHYDGWPRYIVCEADGMTMAYVPCQTLLMGGGTDLDEVPARTVEVNHFYIDLHEVTNRQFDDYRRSGGSSQSACFGRPGYREYWVSGHNDHHPVRNVSWHEAAGYAEWVGRMLPTEAQWEAAARGNDQRIYPWGNEEQSDLSRYLCNARTAREDFDGYASTAPVLSYSAGISPFGVYNLAGNVWEWCADWYDPGRYAYPSDEDPATGLDRGARAFGDRNYPNPLAKDIREARVGPPVGAQRVIRGGSFADPIQRCRVDARAAAGPGVRQHHVGFRCALPLPPPTPPEEEPAEGG